MKIVAIIPCYNEKDTILDVVRVTKKHVNKIIVVDSSTDCTPDLVEKNFPEVLLIKEKKGKGNQIRRGIEEVKKYHINYVVFIDSDGERDPNDIPKLLQKLDETDVDMIIGSRNKMRSRMRKFLNSFTVFWIWVLTGFKLDDALSGFIIIKENALRKMKLKSKNFEVETEMVLEAYRNKLKIVQENVSVPKISKSGCNIRYILQINAFFDMWSLRWIRNKECRLSVPRKLFLGFFSFIGWVLTGWSVSGLNYKF